MILLILITLIGGCYYIPTSSFIIKLEKRRRWAAGWALPNLFVLLSTLDSLRSSLSFHSFIHQGLPFGHHCPSLWSPMSIPLVTKVIPLSHWSLRVFPLVIKVPHLHLHSFEVKCDERTNKRTGRNHEPCLLLV